ncbi:zinc transporter ZIP1-like [Anopheles bellator]|uniref:zinc transporter ZIP1-like n=1 Tax=Anopheles bellator TaxID=139047 RepID=UPI0026494ACC|nr:zinc transporter ZIP1-like [Anopheles bellator]
MPILQPAPTLATLVVEGALNATLGLVARHEEGEDDEDDSPTVAKAVTMVVLFSASMLCGLLPFQLVRWFKINPEAPSGNHLFFIRLLLSFGGGALLSTTFLHLLPEINHSISLLVESGALPPPEDLPFPLGEFLLTGGFFVIYLIEEIVHWWMHRRSAKARAASRVDPAITAIQKEPLDSSGIVADSKHSHHASNHSHLPIGNVSYPITDVDGRQVVPDLNGDVVASDKPEEPGSSSTLRGLLIVLALSIHELFEGLAVGLERSPSAVWLLFGAVAAHKFVIAFCVAFELLVAAVRFRVAVAYIFVYSVVSPLGIGIGIALSSVSDDANDTIEVVSVVLQGMASGTLVYVIFFEILAKDSGHSHGGGAPGGGGGAADGPHGSDGGHSHDLPATSGLWQFFAVLVGFALLLGIQIATEHEHSHSHGGSDDHDHEHHH